GRDVRRVAEDGTVLGDYDEPGVHPHPHRESDAVLRFEPFVEHRHGVDGREACAHGALGVVAVGLRPAEVGDEPVAEVLRHVAAELLARLIRRPAGAAGITEPPAALRAVSSVGTVGVAAGRAADHALSFHRGRRPRRIWLVLQGARRCQRRREGAVELAWGRSWAGTLVPAIWIPQAADATLGCMTAEPIDTSTHRLDLLAH